jgi:hypothetical protein
MGVENILMAFEFFEKYMCIVQSTCEELVSDQLL